MSEGRSDPLSGVKCFTIGGRMVFERQRALGMTAEERRWRAQFLKDQVLSHEEPREVPEYYKATTNFIRRLWNTPLWKFQKFLQSKVGPEWAYSIRHYLGKTSAMIAIGYIGVYYFKYYSNDFKRARPLEYMRTRSPVYPDDPDYPNFKVKTKQEYVDHGFYSSPLAVKIEKPPPVVKTPPSKRVRTDGSEIVCPAPTKN